MWANTALGISSLWDFLRTALSLFPQAPTSMKERTTCEQTRATPRGTCGSSTVQVGPSASLLITCRFHATVSGRKPNRVISRSRFALICKCTGENSNVPRPATLFSYGFRICDDDQTNTLKGYPGIEEKARLLQENNQDTYCAFYSLDTVNRRAKVPWPNNLKFAIVKNRNLVGLS